MYHRDGAFQQEKYSGAWFLPRNFKDFKPILNGQDWARTGKCCRFEGCRVESPFLPLSRMSRLAMAFLAGFEGHLPVLSRPLPCGSPFVGLRRLFFCDQKGDSAIGGGCEIAFDPGDWRIAISRRWLSRVGKGLRVGVGDSGDDQ
jgi:hypothetical protein